MSTLPDRATISGPGFEPTGPPRGPVDLRVDVTDSVDLEGRHELAAWVFAPARLAPVPTVVFCLHGGSGVTKDYWHLEVDGHPGYSFAEWFASRGIVVIAVDDLGVGESSRPVDSWKVTSLEVAKAHRALEDHVVAALAAGNLAGLPATADPVRIGLSHGRGGLMRIRAQAHLRSYDALALMGWPNLPPNIPASWWGRELLPVVGRLTEGLRGIDAERALMALPEHTDFVFPPSNAGREAMNALYFRPDVPEAVVAADMAAGSPQDPGPVTMVGMLVPGSAADDAGQIDVPVFSGWGEHDTSADSRREPEFFRSSPDVTFQLLPRSGHCENFASTREQHWQRLALWLRDVWSMNDRG